MQQAIIEISFLKEQLDIKSTDFEVKQGLIQVKEAEPVEARMKI